MFSVDVKIPLYTGKVGLIGLRGLFCWLSVLLPKLRVGSSVLRLKFMDKAFELPAGFISYLALFFALVMVPVLLIKWDGNVPAVPSLGIDFSFTSWAV